MSARTIFLSRLIGLYCLLAGAAMVARKQATVAAVTSMIHDAPLMMLLGILLVIGGLATVLAHNVWSGGATPVIVTVIGWGALLKGVMLLLLPTESAAEFYLHMLHYEQCFYFYMAPSLILGAYLTYAGFTSAPR
jgi:hypothetical protein